MKKTLTVLLTSIAVIFAGSPVSAETYPEAPSQQPIITKIVSKKTSAKFVSITVYVKVVNTYNGSGVSPRPNVRVKVGSKTCVVKVTFGACTIKKVKLNSKVKVQAEQFNKYGKGPSLKKSIKANSDTKTYYLTKGKSRSEYQKGSVLSTSSVKFESVQSFNQPLSARTFRSSGARSIISSSEPRFFADANQVMFDLSDAVALAKPQGQTQTSGFYKLEANGSQSDPLINGSLSVENFYIAPNDEIFATLSSKQPLVTGGTPCLLIKISTMNGVPLCIDSTLSSVQFGNIQPGQNLKAILPPPIQFDSQSNIYYLGGADTGNAVLRKYSNGVSTDLINSNIRISSYFVQGNGEVIICGSTQSSNTDWLRKISATGQLSTISNGVMCNFMKQFTDGKLWIGSWGKGDGGPMGVIKYDLTSGKLTSWTESWDSKKRIPELRDQDIPESDATQGFRQAGNGAFVKDIFVFPTTKATWAIAGQNNKTSLVRYAPSILFAETSISSYQMGVRVLNTLVLTGTDAQEKNRLVLYDTQSGFENVIFDGSNEIEIYDMVFIAGSNTLMFSGLRFSDNQYVVGKVTL